MLLLKYVLLIVGMATIGAAGVMVVSDVYRRRVAFEPAGQVRWRSAARLAALAWMALIPGLSVMIVPSGMAGVRVSQLSGTLAGTLYPGTHFVVPLVHRDNYLQS